jgi:DNA-binding NtrC family response regulator
MRAARTSEPDRLLLEPAVTLLAVGPEEDLYCLRAICGGTGWTLREARTLQEALTCLDHNAFPVVLCQQDLPDGPWTELLEAASDLPEAPYLIVWSRHADSALWAAVLNLGGYDVLATPFRVPEVVHAVRMAALGWRERRSTAGKIPAPARVV